MRKTLGIHSSPTKLDGPGAGLEVRMVEVGDPRLARVVRYHPAIANVVNLYQFHSNMDRFRSKHFYHSDVIVIMLNLSMIVRLERM